MTVTIVTIAIIAQAMDQETRMLLITKGGMMKKETKSKSEMLVCEFVGHDKPHDHLTCIQENYNIAPGDLQILAAGHAIQSSLLKRK